MEEEKELQLEMFQLKLKKWIENVSDKFESLLGRRLRFTVTDPWEFETENQRNAFDGVVIAVEGISLLFQSDIGVKIDSITYYSFICSPRLESGSLDQLKNNIDMWCSATALPKDEAQSNNPFDLSWWRGGGGLIGTLSVLPIPKPEKPGSDPNFR